MSWIGGKKILRKKILEQFPELYSRYVEVFGGAGWILFAEERKIEFEVYNDVNSDLVNLYRCVKYHPEALQAELKNILMSREQFIDAKVQIETRGLTDIQRAAKFFILVKESYGTDLRSFGVRPKNMNNAIEYLDEISRRLSTVVIENLDFEHILNTYDKADTLFYLDPPYYKTEKYYPDRFLPEDHIRLKKKLSVLKGKFLLSYNDCAYIREMYKEYNIIEVERSHNLIIQGKKPRYMELIIRNY